MPRILMLSTEPRSTPLSGESEVVVRVVPGLPEQLVSAHDWSLADLAVLAAGQGAEHEEFDAVCVADLGDFGANALRSVLDIPVVAAGRSALFYALSLGSRFAVVTPQSGYNRAKKLVQEYGLSGQSTGVIAFSDDADRSTITAAAARAVDDGAEVLVLGGACDAITVQALETPLPIIDPAALSILLAESFLGLSLAQSRRTYPVPQARKPDLVKELMGIIG